ncbi:hypothetical protein GCM10009001_20340 [Virgibacillus siamensis]|uniref:DUF3098 domain-containing protein n=1 Tax=Virgibacillus siamensis TaxID=480071 RepID=A0ABP3R5A0_9BACI
MRKHSPLGKVVFWLGFLLSVLGIAFNDSLGMITDGPDIFSFFSVPAIITGVILIIVSNFFKNRDD